MIKKCLGIVFCFFVCGSGCASNDDLILEKGSVVPGIRQFYPMSLDIFHVTTPDIEKLQPYNAQRPENIEDGEIFKGLISFMSQFVFLQREGVLWDDEVLYPEVVLTTTDLIVSKAHGLYEIQLTDIEPITQMQEWYRQKNVAFMIDLWLMALGQRSHKDGPRALKKLMCHLGVPGQGMVRSEESFMNCLNQVCVSYKQSMTTLSLQCRRDFETAAQALLKWICEYETEFSL